MAFKHRMKVFFRPAGLKGSAAEAPAQLTWKLSINGGKLTGIQVANPTAFHVSLILLTATVSGQTVKAKTDMVAPFGSSLFELEAPVNAPASPLQLDYTFVNDYGGNVKATASAPVR
jgi:chaperone protein EcpD